jgi:hypothetical protein
LLLLVLASTPGCEKASPSEPETRPVLVLAFSGPCDHRSVLVTLDGTPVGRVLIPGSTSYLVSPGSHELQVGGTPAFTIDMPADRDLALTDVPSPCP